MVWKGHKRLSETDRHPEKPLVKTQTDNCSNTLVIDDGRDCLWSTGAWLFSPVLRQAFKWVLLLGSHTLWRCRGKSEKGERKTLMDGFRSSLCRWLERPDWVSCSQVSEAKFQVAHFIGLRCMMEDDISCRSNRFQATWWSNRMMDCRKLGFWGLHSK